MSASLVGSEMCIRDRPDGEFWIHCNAIPCVSWAESKQGARSRAMVNKKGCLLYTSDAADDM
eukprot:10778474-Alexandrium_andersonii.AAC.1